MFTNDELSTCGHSSKKFIESIDLKLNLIHEDEYQVSLGDLAQRYNLIYFGYSFCPDVCPIDLGRNMEAISSLDTKKYQILPIFITVDPFRDTPQRLKEYTNLLDDRLVGLTGSEDQIKNAKKNFMVYGKKSSFDDNYLVDHSTFTYLVAKSGKLLWYFKREDSPEYIREIIECFADG